MLLFNTTLLGGGGGGGARTTSEPPPSTGATITMDGGVADTTCTNTGRESAKWGRRGSAVPAFATLNPAIEPSV